MGLTRTLLGDIGALVQLESLQLPKSGTFSELLCSRIAERAARKHFSATQIADTRVTGQRQARRGDNLAVPEFKRILEVPTSLPLQDYLRQEGLIRPGSFKVLDQDENRALEVSRPKTFRVGIAWEKR